MSRFEFADEVRAVLFDVGNTLMSIDHARIAEILTGAGLACDEAAVRHAEMHARPRLDPYLSTVASRESAETTARYAALIVEGVDPAAPRSAREAVVAVWRTLWSVPMPDARATLDGLAERGLRLGVVSNSDGRVRSRLEAADLATPLECIVDSGLVRVEKPDPRIFAIAAEALATPPSACVYLGDFMSLDVHGARGAGMHAVLVDPIGAWADADAPRARSLTEFASRLERRS